MRKTHWNDLWIFIVLWYLNDFNPTFDEHMGMLKWCEIYKTYVNLFTEIACWVHNYDNKWVFIVSNMPRWIWKLKSALKAHCIHVE